MKKKFFVLLFAAMMACGGCGSADTDTTDQQTEQETAQTEAMIEGMKEELSSYGTYLEPEAAVEAGMYTITSEGVVGGQEYFDAFLSGEMDYVILCQYTQKGGAVLDYLIQREDGSYLILSDSTRDGYSEEEKVGEDYEVQEFTALKVFTDFQVREDSTPVTIGVLTNENGLTAEDFRTYWNEGSTANHQAYLLFVY